MVGWKRHRRQLDRVLSRYGSFALKSHAEPDADALGSMLGMMHILRAAGKTANPYVDVENVNGFRWIPGAEEINRALPLPRFDCLIVFDCPAIQLLGNDQGLFRKAEKVVVIDHHEVDPMDELKGDLKIVEATASSTAEMIYYLATSKPSLTISADAAGCLYAGLASDTINFSTRRTSAASLRAAAGLVALGANPQEISDHLSVRTFAQVKTEWLALSRAKLLENGIVLYTEITDEMLGAAGAVESDLGKDHTPNQLTKVAGPKFFVVLYQRGATATHIEVRTYDPFDSAAFCEKFGGGGHVPAGGATINKSIDEVRPLIQAAIAREVLERVPCTPRNLE